MIYLFVFVGIIVVIGIVAVLSQAGVLPSFGDGSGRGAGWSSESFSPGPGCLLAIIVAALVWFALWGVVLVLALKFLRDVI